MNSVKSLAKSVNEIKTEISTSMKEAVQLRTEVEFFKQQSRANSMEICGIQEKNGENVIYIVRKIGNSVGMSISDNYIITVHLASRFRNVEAKKKLKNMC